LKENISCDLIREDSGLKKAEKMNDDILKKCVDCSQHTLAKVCPKCPLFPYFIIFHLDHNGKI